MYDSTIADEPVEDTLDQLREDTYVTVRHTLYEAEQEMNRVQQIINDILQRKRTFKDNEDVSLHPSYTKFKVPYPGECLRRYKENKLNLESALQREMNTLLIYQPTAYDAARLARHLAITSLWPPLHNRRDIDGFKDTFFRLPYKDKKRLDFVMHNKIT